VELQRGPESITLRDLFKPNQLAGPLGFEPVADGLQLALNADEVRRLVLALLIEPIGEHEPKKVVVRVRPNRLEECFTFSHVGHRRAAVEGDCSSLRCRPSYRQGRLHLRLFSSSLSSSPSRVLTCAPFETHRPSLPTMNR